MFVCIKSEFILTILLLAGKLFIEDKGGNDDNRLYTCRDLPNFLRYKNLTSGRGALYQEGQIFASNAINFIWHV